jgi:hypothetical protein
MKNISISNIPILKAMNLYPVTANVLSDYEKNFKNRS